MGREGSYGILSTSFFYLENFIIAFLRQIHLSYICRGGGRGGATNLCDPLKFWDSNQTQLLFRGQPCSHKLLIYLCVDTSIWLLLSRGCREARSKQAATAAAAGRDKGHECFAERVAYKLAFSRRRCSWLGTWVVKRGWKMECAQWS